MKEYRQKIYGNLNISEEDWQYFAGKFEPFAIQKNVIITPLRGQENYLYYLENGLIRSFTDENGKERTLRFKFSGVFVSAYASFVTGQPSRIEQNPEENFLT